jgi:serine/threonine-protein kinase HipA
VVQLSSQALAVWSANHRAGFLDRSADQREFVFAYDPVNKASDVQVSLTMPVRLESWLSSDLHPVFQMNLPEGALLDAIRRAISKIADEDDLTILRVTGGNQIGRNRFSLAGDTTAGVVETSESLDELLSYPDTEELFHDLVLKYAIRSGISGVQPKVMLDATKRGTASVGGYIVKSCGSEYPQLAANEFFCMTAARLAGLPVPSFYLSDNGGLFVMERFDCNQAQGISRGFEDMCVLQGLATKKKYASSYERLAKSIKSYVSPQHLQAAREQFFGMLVLSSMVRNGDAHLKNFGVLYERPGADVYLAPVYDIVTTTVYMPRDVPALSLSGTKKWWSRKMLEQFAVAHLSLPPARVGQIIQQMALAVIKTQELLIEYMQQHQNFKDIGTAMLNEWQAGVAGMVSE